MRRTRFISRLLAVAACVIFVPVVGAQVAVADTESPTEGFTCMAPHNECVYAARRASTAKEAVRILTEEALASHERTVTVDPPSGFGFTTNRGSGSDTRYYGWQLSRSTFGRTLTYDRCEVGPGGTCRYTGTVQVQANLTFNGFSVVPTASIYYVEGPTARPTIYVKCDEKGAFQGLCGTREATLTSFPFPAGNQFIWNFNSDNFYLMDNNDYDVSFAFGMQVPTYTEAFSGWFDSLDFRRDASGVYFPGYGEGDSA